MTPHSGTSSGAASAAAAEAVTRGDLAIELGEALAGQIRSREVDGRSRLSTDDERQWAHAWLLRRLRDVAQDQVAQGRETLSRPEEDHLIESVINVVFGAGALERWLRDDNVQDIHICGADQVFIKFRDGTRRQVEPIAADDEALRVMISNLARTRGRVELRFDYSNPVIDMQLPNGDRLNAMYAVSTRPAVTIRRHNFSLSSLDELQALGTMSPTIRDFLAAAVKSRRNIVVSGGTGTGKTTLLRALLNEIGPEERIITVEDNLELGLSRFPDLHPNLVECEARSANLEGVGAVPLSQLVVHSLRQDPDRVVVGECRGAETVPMLLAMSQGNDGSMTTIHADSSKAVFARIRTYAATLAKEKIEPEHADLLIRDAVHFVVHLGFSGGKRVVNSIREVDPTSEAQLLSSEVFAPAEDGTAQPAFGVSSMRHRQAFIEAGFDPRRAVGGRT